METKEIVKKLNDICKPAKEQFFATDPLEAGYEYECEVKPGTTFNFYVHPVISHNKVAGNVLENLLIPGKNTENPN